MKWILPAVVVLFFTQMATSARAEFLSFQNITNNNALAASIGEAQLSVEVTEPGSQQALFTFFNAGPAASSISEVYFDDGTLLGISTIDNSGGVDFRRDASPPNLPGANLAIPPFQVTAGFLAESVPAPPANGVNPGDSLGILFDLEAGKTFSDVLTDLASGALRIGIHVIAFDSGASESFINDDSFDPGGFGFGVPEPSSAINLLTAAAAGLLWVGYRRRRRATV